MDDCLLGSAAVRTDAGSVDCLYWIAHTGWIALMDGRVVILCQAMAEIR